MPGLIERFGGWRYRSQHGRHSYSRRFHEALKARKIAYRAARGPQHKNWGSR